MADNESNVVAGGGKWTGGIENVHMDCPVEAAWELCSDWTHWQRWWPLGEPVSEHREGENRKPGCLRFVESAPGVWIYERLVEVDNENFFLSYTMEDNVFCGGVTGYAAKVQFRGTVDGKTTLEYWTYEVDPMEQMTREEFASFMKVFLTDYLVKGIEAGARRLAAGLPPKPTAEELSATAQ